MVSTSEEKPDQNKKEKDEKEKDFKELINFVDELAATEESFFQSQKMTKNEYYSLIKNKIPEEAQNAYEGVTNEKAHNTLMKDLSSLKESLLKGNAKPKDIENVVQGINKQAAFIQILTMQQPLLIKFFYENTTAFDKIKDKLQDNAVKAKNKGEPLTYPNIGGAYSFDSGIINPPQRIPRYEMLLKGMAKTAAKCFAQEPAKEALITTLNNSAKLITQKAIMANSMVSIAAINDDLKELKKYATKTIQADLKKVTDLTDAIKYKSLDPDGPMSADPKTQRSNQVAKENVTKIRDIATSLGEKGEKIKAELEILKKSAKDFNEDISKLKDPKGKDKKEYNAYVSSLKKINAQIPLLEGDDKAISAVINIVKTIDQKIGLEQNSTELGNNLIPGGKRRIANILDNYGEKLNSQSKTTMENKTPNIGSHKATTQFDTTVKLGDEKLKTELHKSQSRQSIEEPKKIETKPTHNKGPTNH